METLLLPPWPGIAVKASWWRTTARGRSRTFGSKPEPRWVRTAVAAAAFTAAAKEAAAKAAAAKAAALVALGVLAAAVPAKAIPVVAAAAVAGASTRRGFAPWGVVAILSSGLLRAAQTCNAFLGASNPPERAVYRVR